MSLDPSTIVYGLFKLKNEEKNKYAVILHNDSDDYIITTFTTSKKRAGDNSTHGINQNPECYVFKSKVTIGVCPNHRTDFSFEKDTTIVPDYGIQDISVRDFLGIASNLETVCILHEKEYLDLLYFFYRCKKTKLKYVRIFEKILHQLSTRE
jgi:hypothetical protein